MKNRIVAFLLLVLSQLVAVSAWAQSTLTWTGATSNVWSEPTNWSPNQAPVAGDSLVFSGTPTTTTSVNDLFGLSIASIGIFGNGYAITGNPLFVTSGVAWTGSNNTIDAGLDFGANSVVINGTDSGATDLVLSGGLHGTGAISIAGPVRVVNNTSSFNGAVQLVGGTPNGSLYLQDATLPATVAPLAGTTLSGFGTVGSIFATGASLIPITPSGAGGRITTTDLQLDAGAYFANVGGLVAGTDYSQVVATGTVTLSNNPALDVAISNGFTPAFGQAFTIIDNQGASAVNGTFNGLAEGATFSIGPNAWTITYVGGDGNDVVLVSLNQLGTTTSVFSSQNPAPFGTSVTFAAVVSSSDIPTGTVTFSIDGTPVDTVALSGGSASFTTSTLTVGAHTIGATYNPDASHLTSSGSLVQSTTGTQTITWDTLRDRGFNESPFTLSATGGGSGNPVTFESSTTGVCTTTGTNGEIVNLVGIGTCTITASQAGGGGFEAATPVTRSFQVTKAPQEITFGGFVDRTFGDAPFQVSATGGGSGNPVTFTSQSTSVCTTEGVNPTTITIVGAGTCTIRLFQAGGDFYQDVETIQSFLVAQASQAITFNALPDRAAGDPPFTLSATGGASGNPVTFSSSTTGVCTTTGANGATVTIVGAGTCTITASQAGNANFSAATPVTRSFTVSGVVVTAEQDYFSDFSGDSRADISWQRNDGASAIWLMNGATQIGGRQLFGAGTGWTLKLVADFTGDARADLVWQHTDGRVAMWTMNGITQTGGAVLLAAGTGWTPKLAGDFNADGRADILWEHADGRSAIWLMNGTTQIGGGVLFGAGTGWFAQAVADFNGDGRADILWTHTDGRAAMWLMNGSAQVGGGVLMGAGTGWSPRLVADFNNDQRTDILWQHTDGRTDMWLMNGPTKVGGALLLPAGTGWSVTRVGDANADGRADIVWQRTDGSIAVWMMNGSTIVAATRMTDAGTSFKVIRMADFNNDGRADIVTESADGTITMWLSNGTTFTPTVLLAGGTGWTLQP